jgi:syntaxin-binding protein 1
MDMVAPFLHEFTYQAMANDLLPIEEGIRYSFVLSWNSIPYDLQWYVHSYKFQSSLGAYEDKKALLSDADTVWTAVRHLHMREAIDKLMLDFNKFLADNEVFKG